MLEHHADACGDCRLTIGNVGFLASDEYLALIGLVKAIQDRHQRGLACAIFADDPVDRSRHHADGNVFVGVHRAECLGYALQLDRRSGSRLPLRGCMGAHF